jgi:antitoxin component of MazEF toxin-antitoxin module
MTTNILTIEAIGDSTGIVLPEELMKTLQWQQGDHLLIERINGGVTLSADKKFAHQTAQAHTVMHQDRTILRDLDDGVMRKAEAFDARSKSTKPPYRRP